MRSVSSSYFCYKNSLKPVLRIEIYYRNSPYFCYIVPRDIHQHNHLDIFHLCGGMLCYLNNDCCTVSRKGDQNIQQSKLSYRKYIVGVNHNLLLIDHVIFSADTYIWKKKGELERERF